MASLIDIEGIGPAHAEKLGGQGLKTTDDLLKAAATPKDRQDLEAATGISGALILGWVNRADLFRVKGIGTQYSDLLEAAGVDTVKELAQRRADNLTAKMAEVNEQKKLVRQLPTEGQVAAWIEAAKTLPGPSATDKGAAGYAARRENRKESGMRYCSSCGTELRGDEKFCAECGQVVPEPGPVAVAAVAAAGAGAAAVAPAGEVVAAAAAGDETVAAVNAETAAVAPLEVTAAYPPPAPLVESAAPIAPPPYAPAAYPPPPPPPPPAAPPRSMKWVWIGGGAAVAVIAIVCVLVFVVFNGGNGQEAEDVPTTLQAAATTLVTVPVAATETTATPTSTTAQTVPPTAPPTSTTTTAAQDSAGAEQVVLQVFAALENQDVDALLAVMDPTILGALPAGEALDAAKAAIKESIAAMGKMKFSGIEMTTEMTSPTTATVTLTAGSVTVTDANGQTTSEDIKESSSPVTVDLVKRDGQWYMSSSAFL